METKELQKRIELLEQELSQERSRLNRELEQKELAIKNHLTYKLGETVVQSCKNAYGLFLMPLALWITYKKWKQQKNGPLLSIVIPAYNAEKYIKNCIESIASQNIDDYEIIVIDDGSTDNTLLILEKLAKSNKKIKLYKQNHKHAGAARNLGISKACGKYIHFVDADDWLEPNCYSVALKDIITKKSDAVMFNFFRFNNQTGEKTVATHLSNPSKTNFNIKYENSKNREYILRASVVPWNKIYRRSFLLENNIKFDELIVANDRTFYFKFINSFPYITIINKPLINYRIANKDSLIGKERIKNFECQLMAFDNIKDIYISSDDYWIVIDQFLTDLRIFYEKANEKQKSLLNIRLREYFNANKNYFSQINKLSGRKSAAFYNNFIKPAEIPVVFSVDDNYVKYLSVALISLIQNASRGFNYRIIILYRSLSEDCKNKLKKIEQEGFSIEFYNIEPLVNSLNLYSRAHYSISMYYRLFIPRILHSYSKAIYLDCDIVVNYDISQLFILDMGENWVQAAPNLLNNEMRRYTKWRMNIDYPKYFNSGVLVIDIKKWNDNRVLYKCLELLDKYRDLVCPDQDVLNIVCNGKVHYLDLSWNYAWQHIVLDSSLSEDQQKIINDISPQEVKIVHYTSGVKPWKLDNWKNPYGKQWWDYAKQSPFYSSMLDDLKIFKKKNSFVLSSRA